MAKLDQLSSKKRARIRIMSQNKTDSILKVNSLEKVVVGPNGGLQILTDVNFEIFSAETVAITGPSGSGKSTLLGIMAGLDLPTGGSIHIDNIDFFSLNEDQRAKLRGQLMGFVFQSFQLIPSLTAIENVMLPLELLGLPDPNSAAKLVLDRVDLGNRIDHYPRQLSGGEQQRVAIARAFVVNPKLLLADEPTGNLDVKTGEKIISLLFDLNREQGTTLVLVTHDPQLANRCQRIFRIEEGLMRDLSVQESSIAS